jgi:pimeloyl-ACP methyl ester carboxylesterase
MFVHECGSVDRPAIVFLHGNGTNGTQWHLHLEQLAEYHCLVPDFPGYGRSKHEEWVSLEQTAEQVIDLIRHRTKAARAHLVSLSLGGSTALTLLSKAPALIDHAIIDGAGVLPLPALPLIKVGFHILQPFLKTDFVIRTLARTMKIPDDGYASFKHGMLSMSPTSFTRSFLQALSLRQPPGLEQVTGPVLFVAGEREPKAVKQSNVMLAQLLPNAQCRMAPGLGHAWMIEVPRLHIQMVRAWLADQPLPPELAACCI